MPKSSKNAPFPVAVGALITIVVLCSCLGGAWSASAQLSPDLQLKGQANLISRAVVLGVQQGISSLPPSSPQSFSYEFNPETEAFERTSRLGPTAFISPNVLGRGNFGVRLSVSYFELHDTFAPVDYEFRTPQGDLIGFTQFGLKANADVTVIKLSANYGFAKRFEANLNVPLVVVSADASTKFPVLRGDVNAEPPVFGLATQREQLPILIGTGNLVYRKLGLEEPDFSQGGNFGLGRTSVAVKGLIYKGKRIGFAVGSELFFPSPNEDEFAGPASFAILPRAIASLSATDWLSLHSDVGYDFDFKTEELRRFVWNAGVSLPFPRVTFDLGVGGSEYAKASRWTLAGPVDVSDPGSRLLLGQLRLLKDENNDIGTTFVDLLTGLKVEVLENWVLAGAVAIPLDSTKFRPDVLATAAIERGF